MADHTVSLAVEVDASALVDAVSCGEWSTSEQCDMLCQMLDHIAYWFWDVARGGHEDPSSAGMQAILAHRRLLREHAAKVLADDYKPER